MKEFSKSLLRTLAFAGLLSLTGCYECDGDISKYKSTANISRLKTRLDAQPQQRNYKADNYAVLISDRSEPGDRFVLSRGYRFLMNMDYPPENIFILDYDGLEQSDYPVDGEASAGAIQLLFEHLSRVIDKEDILFIYFGDHGNQERANIRKNSVISLYNDTHIHVHDMDYYARKIRPKQAVVFFDHCFSEDFARKLGKRKIIAISSDKRFAYYAPEGNPEFAELFFDSHEFEETDIDGNGRVSIKEAFEFATQTFTYTREGIQKSKIFSAVDANKVFLENRQKKMAAIK